MKLSNRYLNKQYRMEVQKRKKSLIGVFIPGKTLYIDCNYTLRLLSRIDKKDWDSLCGIDLYEKQKTGKNNYGYCSYKHCGIEFVTKKESEIMLSFYKDTGLKCRLPKSWLHYVFTCDFDDWSRPQTRVWLEYIKIFREYMCNNFPEMTDWIDEASCALNDYQGYEDSKNEITWREFLEIDNG